MPYRTLRNVGKLGVGQANRNENEEGEEEHFAREAG